MKTAIKDCDVVGILKIIDKTHTFETSVSSFEDKEKVLAEWINFGISDKNEKLEVYSNRYYKQLDKCEKMGLANRNNKKRVYRYLRGLRDYSRSALVQLNVLSYLANVNDAVFATYRLDTIVEELQKYDQTENRVGMQNATTNKFAVSAIEGGYLTTLKRERTILKTMGVTKQPQGSQRKSPSPMVIKDGSCPTVPTKS
jgi:hypothetical protein